MPETYDAIVIGGGAAGLAAAGLSANLGARTLLIEKTRLGGDCTWTGCVPSKTLLHAGHVAQTVREAAALGISTGTVTIDFGRVMEHVRQIRERIYTEADTPEHFEAMGVTVRQAEARFVDAHSVELDDGSRAKGRRIFLATGSSPHVPSIEGLETAGFHTSESIFEIDRQPRRLIIFGAGPVGIEMAQAFQRLGTETIVVDRTRRILQNDDREPAEMLAGMLEREGVRFYLNREIRGVTGESGALRVELAAAGSGRETGEAPLETIEGDMLLVAAGRRPTTETLNLEAAGVAYDEQGIRVDESCRTNVSHIYAIGDVTGRYAFAHMAEHMAKIATANALLKIPKKLDTAHVTWATYTDPELAHVGATARQLKQRGRRFEKYRFPYDRLDRAVTDGQRGGMIVVYARPLDGRILGATILGARAGEMISEIALAMRHRVPLRKISDTIHPYPSYGLGVRRAADQWYVKRRSVGIIRAVQRLFGYRGSIRAYGKDEVL